ncbi:MAG TPA: hypothetical protein VK760_08520 [Candidatus Acidoferrales bacterium]|nr:hypothetical protein [Candidatus Acidoferrales bacterium]
MRVYNATHTTRFSQTIADFIQPGAVGCTTLHAGSFSCSLKILAPVGSDTFDVAAFDQDYAKGNQLSSITAFPFTVKLGVKNVIAMTLGGVFAKVGISLVGSSFLAMADTFGLRLAGVGAPAAQQVQLSAEDPDGNVIVNPSIAIATTLTSNAPSKVNIAPVAGIAGRFTLTPLTETDASASPAPDSGITLTATGTPPSGPAVTTNVALYLEPVAYSGNAQGQVWRLVPWLSSNYTTSSPPPGTIDVHNPNAGSYTPMALDAAGNLYVAWSNDGMLTEYAPGGTTPLRTITGLTNAGDAFTAGTMAVDASGDIYIVNEGVVDEFSVAGGNVPVRALSSEAQGIDVPRGVAVDAAGNLYVGNIGRVHGVSVYPPDTSVTTPSYSLGTPSNGPDWVSLDASGNLFVSNEFANSVEEYKAPLSSSSTVYKTFGSSSTITGAPLVASFDANGNVFIPNQKDGFQGADVLEFTPSAPAIPTRTLEGAYLSAPVDPLGNLYVQNQLGLDVYAPGSSYYPQWSFYALQYASNVVVWP